MKALTLIALVALLAQPLYATEYHVSLNGDDSNKGTASNPLKTITAAANLAQPGDVITVHEGTYRERINPPRGGTSDDKRITYQAAQGETVAIKGSEIVTGWQRVDDNAWKVTLPNAFFGDYNPYKDLIHGDWFNANGRDHHTGEVYLDSKALFEAVALEDLEKPTKTGQRQWYCESDETTTTIYANFGKTDPNKATVEINMREACFYPDTPGRNYITIRGFHMSQAATQWAAPTAEQIGLVGSHWSKGWVIENNVISDSKCVGITLGKDRKSGHNSAQSAEGYNVVVKRALDSGWSKENIGSHVVRNNTISECGAAGICGSMGAAFSTITGNHIYNIHLNKPYGGAEMAGIKIHAAIDTLISNNYIHHTNRALWLDWMAQGTRVTGNLCHDSTGEDLFVEVNHGPFMVDNNIFLSKTVLRDWSQGGAYAHNLVAGSVNRSTPTRETPYHKPHSTEIAGLNRILGGDNRFYNNIFVNNKGLQLYDDAELPLQADGNLYLEGAKPYKDEKNVVRESSIDPELKIVTEADGVYLHMDTPVFSRMKSNSLVTTKLLGKAKIPNLPYVNYDGNPLSIDTDYLGNQRNKRDPAAGPLEVPKKPKLRIKVWPKQD